ncbi:MAG: hypothetical protein JNM19_02745 [Chitinophagaceae bacterium]|nr:hypothetical protein [Chitinophagaceae bacterium]
MGNTNAVEKTPFLETIVRLRTNEEIVIFEKKFTTSAAEEKEVSFFLQTEYENESQDYPLTAPIFEPSAALWAAKIIYLGSQLLLFREETARDIQVLFPEYKDDVTSRVQLSADICLRFLPCLLKKVKEIDPNDPLIPHLETILIRFPYSAIGYFAESGKLQFDDLFLQNDCCSQLVVNRVIAKRDRNTADIQNIKPIIESALGDYQKIFWPGINF